MENYTPKGCLKEVSIVSTHISTTPKRGTLNQKNGFWKVISSIDLSVVKFAELDGENIFKSDEKWRRCLPKTTCMGGSRTNENDCRQKPAYAA